jgi:hypothetical protein
MPIGFLITQGIVALGMAASLWPPSRSGLLRVATWFVSAIVNESPFMAFYYMGISTWLAFTNFHGAQVWLAVGVATAPFIGTPVLVRRSLRSPRHRAGARPEPRAALATPGWQVDQTKPALGRIIFAPLPLSHFGVRRIANLSYGDAGRRNRLDLYRRRRGSSGGPVLTFTVEASRSRRGARASARGGCCSGSPARPKLSERPAAAAPTPGHQEAAAKPGSSSVSKAFRCRSVEWRKSTVADRRFATRVSGGRSPARDPPRARDSSKRGNTADGRCTPASCGKARVLLVVFSTDEVLRLATTAERTLR